MAVRQARQMRGLPLKAFPLGGRWHGEAVTDEGAMIERFFVGPDALIGPLDGSFRGGVSPPAGGEVLSQRWESTQRIAGGRGRRALRAHRTAYPRAPVYGGYPLGQTENFRREKSEWRSAIPSGPPGPGFAKFRIVAVPELRLALPSQRSRCKSRREAQGPPLPNPRRVFWNRRGGYQPPESLPP